MLFSSKQNFFFLRSFDMIGCQAICIYTRDGHMRCRQETTWQTVASDWLDKIKSSWLWTIRSTGLFRAHCTSFPIHSFLLTFFPFIFLLFQSCWSHAQVFGRTLVHEFHIFYSHTEWNFLRHEATWDDPEASIILDKGRRCAAEGLYRSLRSWDRALRVMPWLSHQQLA